MKIFLITALVFSLVACNNHSQQTSAASAVSGKDDTVETKREITLYHDCSINDILLLKTDNHLFESFFTGIEEWYKMQGNVEPIQDSIFVEITRPLLKDFINSITEEQLKSEEGVSKEYEFNKYPSEYKGDKKCSDHIRLRFDGELCQFYLSVENSFYVEDFGCSDHETIYIFAIKNSKIKIVEITVAG